MIAHVHASAHATMHTDDSTPHGARLMNIGRLLVKPALAAPDVQRLCSWLSSVGDPTPNEGGGTYLCAPFSNPAHSLVASWIIPDREAAAPRSGKDEKTDGSVMVVASCKCKRKRVDSDSDSDGPDDTSAASSDTDSSSASPRRRSTRAKNKTATSERLYLTPTPMASGYVWGALEVTTVAGKGHGVRAKVDLPKGACLPVFGLEVPDHPHPENTTYIIDSGRKGVLIDIWTRDTSRLHSVACLLQARCFDFCPAA